ncbi:hypothetical protein X757_25805 [Mesorhizobium sp. LSHC414A00]|nr:DUF480 domain-containing protein [Mesorhizobium sp. LSHC414A00]ESX70185.1 hypothetical protein X757_25805 [Mesorhizobium sp. LSHC414A00]
MSDDLPILNPVEARVLGCLIEKRELTPDVYPLTLNAALAAANQKTAREPVMALEQTEVHRTLKLLEQKGLVRQMFGSRVERYEHQMAQRFSLTTPQTAVIGLLLLRGPQTAHELLARAERMARFSSVEDLRGELDYADRPPPAARPGNTARAGAARGPFYASARRTGGRRGVIGAAERAGLACFRPGSEIGGSGAGSRSPSRPA